MPKNITVSDSSEDSGARKANRAINAFLIPILWGVCTILFAGLLGVGVYLWNNEHATNQATAQHAENLRQEFEGHKVELQLMKLNMENFAKQLDRTNRVIERIAEKQGVFLPP